MTAEIIPRTPVSIRVATLGDLPFMDGLQKKHGKALGYFPRKQFEGYIETGGVLIAEEGATPIGYCISRDRYLKRDELGVIYQLCVAPGLQRKLVGASLIREVFERSAYGCRLYCCWCAQDLEANYFWESLGFVPVAFRAGGAKKVRTCPERARASRRVHIFWQRRIHADDEATAYWYPFQTSSGAIREDRLVFPIPPGVHWKDVEAVRLPQERGLGILPERSSGASISKSGYSRKRSGETPKPRKPKPHQVAIVVGGRIKYIDRPGAIVSKEQGERNAPPVERAARKPKSPMGKLDPKYLVAARELRDRYLEQFNAERIVGIGKYDVARALPKQGPHADPLPVYDSTELVEVRAREKMPLRLPEAA